MMWLATTEPASTIKLEGLPVELDVGNLELRLRQYEMKTESLERQVDDLYCRLTYRVRDVADLREQIRLLTKSQD